MYVILGVALFLTLCVIRYVTQARSRLHQVALRYPTCFKELPIVGSLYHLLHNSSEELLSNMLKAVDISAQLGGIGRVCGLNYYYLVVTDAADIGEVLKHYLNKDFICTYVQRITFQGSIFNTDHTVSKDRRHIMLPSFNSKQLPGYIDSTWRAAVRLSQTLAPYAGKGPFRIAYFLGGFCYDSVIGAADVEEIREEFSSGKACFNLLQCFQLAVQRWTSMWMQADLLHQLSRNHREMTRRVATLYTYMDRAQEIRRNKLNNKISQQSKDTTGSIQIKPGLFDSLICSKLTRREVSEEILVMMGATGEASIVIYFTLRMLGLYPIVQKRVYEELLNISVEPDQPVEYLTKTPYLDLVIKEVMRLYPPVPVVIRAAHTEMELPSGSVLPAGAGIFVSIMSLHRRQKYWGDDADHFDPERFQPERLAVVPDDAYIPFSSGSRSCPGYKFALNTVKLGVCAILRRYAVAGPPAAGPAPDVRVKFEVSLRPVDDSIELVERNVNA